MMKKLAITLSFTITVFLMGSGCSSQIISSDNGTIIIRPGFPDKGIEKALAMAKKECRKIGRSTKVPNATSFNTDIYVFKCIKKN